MTWGSISLFGGFLVKEHPLETLIVIFENVSPKGFSWLKMKYFEISVLTANSRYLQTAALKKGKCHDGRCIHLYWLASRRRWFPKPNWLTWSEPELIIRLLFLLFYCLTVPLHVHVLFPFHFFPESRFRLFKSEKMWSDPIPRPLPGGRGWGAGGTLLYQLCRYVLPHRVGFLRRFGLKMSIHFANFALESGMVFEGSTGVHERIYRFNSKWVRKNEKYASSKCIWRIFCLRSNLSNDNVISA